MAASKFWQISSTPRANQFSPGLTLEKAFYSIGISAHQVPKRGQKGASEITMTNITC